MSPGAMIVQGQYYDGRQPIGVPVTLSVTGEEAALLGALVSARYATHDLRVSPRLGDAERFVTLPDGGQFQCADDPVLDRLPQDVEPEGLVAWLEHRLAVALACVAVIAVVLLLGYVYGLPAAAQRVAARIPIEMEQGLGEQALAWLDDNQWLTPTQLPPDAQEEIRKGFAALTRGLPMERSYRLEFRASRNIGANALALPGGAIVITDDMVKLAESQEEVMAILAHEIGHVERRHAIRILLQGSAAALVAATLTADAAAVAVTGFPIVLAQANYSRALEAEADDFAFQRLRQTGLSPAAFATIMERLAKRDAADGDVLAFLSTHPLTADRIERARAAAEPVRQ